ncbi:hypothetical protein NA57DRAFT_72688 [Rhizodiscina lignyota]|uniref:Uncharacterized protein n=1 Tax=Rhizodiscina lignyota TaxID=1504668 RepID=A0A9P4M814_9PEZI|nr:hypothetical protein NA57DRAFT_72688 [Rhizodiscina lignyota]
MPIPGDDEFRVSTSYANQATAAVIYHILVTLLQDDELMKVIPPSEIAVITGYRGQVSLFSKVLQAIADHHPGLRCRAYLVSYRPLTSTLAMHNGIIPAKMDNFQPVAEIDPSEVVTDDTIVAVAEDSIGRIVETNAVALLADKKKKKSPKSPKSQSMVILGDPDEEEEEDWGPGYEEKEDEAENNPGFE